MTATKELGSYKRLCIDGVRYYGKHLILTAQGCNENLLSLEFITRFMQELVVKIDMVAFGDPLAARFGSGDEIGISAVQLIETSAIVIHTNDAARDMYLDVFSCKGFSDEMVKEVVQDLFESQSINAQVLLR